MLQLRLMDLLYNYDASTRLIKLFEKTKVGYNNFAEGGRTCRDIIIVAASM